MLGKTWNDFKNRVADVLSKPAEKLTPLQAYFLYQTASGIKDFLHPDNKVDAGDTSVDKLSTGSKI